jgi:hypothetical protein
MTTSSPSKKELQELIDDVSGKVQDMLDPALTREDLVGLVQELDVQLNGDDTDEDDEGDEDEE